MSAEPTHLPELDSPTDILRLAELVELLNAHREERIGRASRTYLHIAFIAVASVQLVALAYSINSTLVVNLAPLGTSGKLAFTILASLVIGLAGGVFARPLSRTFAIRFSKKLSDELKSIDADRHRLVGLINEARVTMRPRMSEFQRVELDIRLRQMASL